MEGLTDEEVAEITGLRSGTIRVRLHRARLFVRKELMKTRELRLGRKIESVASRAAATEKSRPPRCKAMFAELSNYLDEQLDDSLCEELERHLDGCGPCQAFLASLQATINDCRRLPSQARIALRRANYGRNCYSSTRAPYPRRLASEETVSSCPDTLELHFVRSNIVISLSKTAMSVAPMCLE